MAINLSSSDDKILEYLLSSRAVRQRCGMLFDLGLDGKLNHFSLDMSALPACADEVEKVIRRNYPTLEIPFHSRWRHFGVGGIDRTNLLNNQLASIDEDERSRIYFDLAIVSVLLDAGAGPKWSYNEPGTSRSYNRSEGLAVASFHMFRQGLFSSNPQKLEVSGEKLARISEAELAEGMQVNSSNPLEGLAGRVKLLNELGRTILSQPGYFGEPGRLGRFYDYLISRSESGGLSASTVLESVLRALGPIWPGREKFHGVNLGDVWRHSLIKTDDETSGLIPFHKLSQWLSYSLLEPLIWRGCRITNIDEMTGLAEYRNGGLFIDAKVIIAKSGDTLTKAHSPSSELIVEWRALTVALLDRIADLVRKKIGKSKEQFPLARVLEGGTWATGRELASRLRPGGVPPLQIISDGTVF
jgi:hypothetical protein